MTTRRPGLLVIPCALFSCWILIPACHARTVTPPVSDPTRGTQLSPAETTQLRVETSAAARQAIDADRHCPAALGRIVGRTSSANEQSQLAANLRALFGKAPADIFGPSKGDIVASGFPGHSAGTTLFSQFAAADYGFLMNKVVLPSGRLIYTRINFGEATIVVPASSGGAAVRAAAILTNLCPIGGVYEWFHTGRGGEVRLHLRCQIDYTLVIFSSAAEKVDASLRKDIRNWALAYIRTIRQVGGRPVRPRVLKTYLKILVH